MNANLTKKYHLDLTKSFFNSFSSVRENYYMFMGKTDRFIDTNQPVPPKENDHYLNYDLPNSIVFAKNMNSTNVRYALDVKQWELGRIYSFYDHEDDVLSSKEYFVFTEESEEYSVFKCLYNNNSAPSTIEPKASQITENEVFVETSDGYKWSYMYTVSKEEYTKFGSGNVLPVYDNKTKSLVKGSPIDIVEIENSGRGYIGSSQGRVVNTRVEGTTRKIYVSGEGQDIISDRGYYKNSAFYVTENAGNGQIAKIIDSGLENEFIYIVLDRELQRPMDNTSIFVIRPYANIEGDGFGAEILVDVDENGTVNKADVIKSGSGYTRAKVTLSGKSNKIDSSGNNLFEFPAILRPIISPRGGHGTDILKELGVHKVMVRDVFEGDEWPLENVYRCFGIMKNPQFDDINIEINVSSSSITEGSILINEEKEIYAEIKSVNGSSLVLKNVSGIIKQNDLLYTENGLELEVNQIDDYSNVDARTKFTVSGEREVFQENEVVIQSATNARGVVHSTKNSEIWLTQVSGEFKLGFPIIGKINNKTMTLNNVETPKINLQSTDVMFIENTYPIRRFDDKPDVFKIILSF